ncbi:MAG: DMT family transporter [Bacteroidales bacterium]|jgi:drug/metabolite transporter (DMT)-like permease|nr:DMT family transporter [Bacteroidales bacterium]
MNHSRTYVYIAAVIAILFWGYSFLWTNSLINNGVPIFTFLFLRLSIAGLLLLITAKLLKKLQKIHRKDLKYFIYMALFEPFLYFIGESYGMKATGSPTITAVVVATIPVFSMLAEKLVYKTHFTFKETLGMFLTIPGVLLVVFEKGSFSIEHIYGLLILLVAVCSTVLYSMNVKKLSENYNDITITTYQFCIGSIFFIPFFLIYGIHGINAGFFTFKIIGPILGLAVFCSSLTYFMWVSVISRLGIARANIFTALIPGISAISAAIVGQEAMDIYKFLGIIIVTTGVILAQVSRGPRPKKKLEKVKDGLVGILKNPVSPPEEKTTGKRSI